MREISHAELLGIDLAELDRERFNHPSQVFRHRVHEETAKREAEWRRSRLPADEDIRDRELDRLAELWRGGLLGSH